MDKREKVEALTEWNKVLKDHPKFARAHLAQQAILMAASELGFRFIDLQMCKLLALGFAVPFLEFWEQRCQTPVRVEVGGVLECLSQAKDPSECFSIPHEDEWFDDPFAGGRTLPPKPPIPPLARSR